MPESFRVELHWPSAIVGGVMIAAIVGLSLKAFFWPRDPINSPISTRELDIAVVKTVLEETQKHCLKLRRKNFMAESSGLEVRAGCK